MTAGVEFEAVVDRLERQAEENSGLVETPIDSPMLQPYEVYDQGLFDLEMLRVYARSWLWLGDTEDLVEAGDYITGTIGYQPVMVIRQEDGSVRGFLNNCRHRASGLVFDADSDGDDDLLIGAPNNNVVGMAALYLNRYGE